MNDEDPDWLRLRYLPFPKVLEEFLKELKLTDKTIQKKSKANGKIGLNPLSWLLHEAWKIIIRDHQ